MISSTVRLASKHFGVSADMRLSDAPKSANKEKQDYLHIELTNELLPLPVDVGILEGERKAWGKPMRLGTS